MKGNIPILKVLLIFVTFSVASNSHAQTRSIGDTVKYNCNSQPRGVFRQLTSATLKLSEEYDDTIWFNKESDLRDNRWTLDPLDGVDPVYKFFLIKNTEKDNKESCGTKIDVKGALISPTGKLFDFKQGTYDFSLGKFKFTTVERDGIVYEADILFYPSPKPIEGGFVSGEVKLRASGKALGIVSMEFRIISFGRG